VKSEKEESQKKQEQNRTAPTCRIITGFNAVVPARVRITAHQVRTVLSSWICRRAARRCSNFQKSSLLVKLHLGTSGARGAKKNGGGFYCFRAINACSLLLLVLSNDWRRGANRSCGSEIAQDRGANPGSL